MPKKKVVTIAGPRVLSLHRTFDRDSGDAIFWIGENDKVKKMTGIKISQFLESLTHAVTIRVTGIGYFLPGLKELQDRGANVVYCHWHATGLEKGLEPEQIAQAFVTLPNDIFKTLKIREDILHLREGVKARLAVMQYRKSAGLKLGAIARSYNVTREDAPDWLKAAFDDLDEMEKVNEHPVEKEIAKQAKKITECVLLNKILDTSTGWMTSAAVVALLGDMDRFATVQGLWHYCGYHVVEGKAPRRQKGKTNTWNSKVQTALWQWSMSMLKTMNKTWRPVYDAYRAQEMAVHEEKHPGCKSIEGHCGARARRRVVKDVLKEYFLAAKGIEQQELKTA
jgi:hypothetical protein